MPRHRMPHTPPLTLMSHPIVKVMALASLVLALCGVGYYLLDPAVDSIHQGLWLAFTTAATVGYGDVVPSNTASRLFSVVVVVVGFAVFSVVTATIAAMLVGNQERRIEREILHDLHAQVRLLRQEIAELRRGDTGP